MEPRILELRGEIDRINRELLNLLSERARIAVEIGRIQTELGIRHYDPVREEKMLAYLTAENDGPFSDGAIKKLFKEIFKATLALEERQDERKFLYSRDAKPETTQVKVKNAVFGGGPLLVAGPCAIESQEQMFQTAEFLAARGVKVLRGGAFKPRTSPYAFQGLGVEGLKLGRAAADRYGMAFVTEVMDTRDIEVVARYADILQIGARNMHNFALLKEAGRSHMPVLLKRGLSATVEEWFYAAEYVLSQGNGQVILAERGIRTYEKWTRNTLDLSGAVLAKQLTHLPVMVDVTHATGRIELMAPLARAALAAGVDAVHVEVHPNPKVAMSDNNQQMDFAQFDEFLSRIKGLLEPAPKEG